MSDAPVPAPAIGIPPIVLATKPGSLVVRSFYPAIKRLLMGRTVSEDIMAEGVRKGILELTEDYKFTELQVSGPVVSLTPYIANYAPLYFFGPAAPPGAFNNVELKKVNSFFVYNNSFVAPTSGNYQTNSGYDLKFRTIEDIEVLLNIPGLPIYWTRFNGQVWIGSMPDKAFNIYMRYQQEHPFPNAGVSSTSDADLDAGDDPIMLPRSWQDICEYMTAMRTAQELNLSNKVSELHTRLYGDQKFQSSDGVDGSPGLIWKRTSDQNRDQTTTRKSFRLRMGRV